MAAIEEKALDVLDGTANENSNAFNGENLLIVIYDQEVKSIIVFYRIYFLCLLPIGKEILSQQRIDERLYYILLSSSHFKMCDGALFSLRSVMSLKPTSLIKIFLITMVHYILSNHTLRSMVVAFA